ncbi:MAG: carbohydrate-binding family 9-like protein [Myxococcales bacterium]|nr:carbohydrate-binding family 9-like protein [Myxococcales bacterium]
MSLRTRTGGLACAWLAGCGDVAALAEPPPGPTLHAGAGAGHVVAGDLEFAGGLRVGPRVFTPAPVSVGAPLRVQFPLTGLAPGTELQVGLRAPRTAGRQVIAGQSRELAAAPEDPRDRWVSPAIAGDTATAELVVPDGWHPRHAVIVLAATRGGASVPAIAGPRMDRGAGVLGVVPVATRPTAVTAAAGAPELDGRPDEALWGAGTLLVTSLEGEPDPTATAVAVAGDPLAPGRGTRVWFAWDAAYLYCAASLPDHDLWSDYTAQDDPLYRQEAFEVFVAGTNAGTRYLEFQVSARGVTFDARFERYRAGDEAWDSSWRAAVATAGTLTPGDRDRGWTAEVAIPWAELCEHTAIACPPRPGMRLRVNAFRLERPDRRRTDALALSPTRAPDFHAWANAAELELQTPRPAGPGQ